MKYVRIIYLILFFNFASLNSAEDKNYYLSICAVFQNEELFIKEWLEFHKLMGVEHFYLFNNLSTDRSLEILQPYIESNLVELINWPVVVLTESDYLTNLQLPAYNHALNLAKKTSTWIAFIDLDEFLFPIKNENLAELLKTYESFAGLAVNWQIYGTSWLKDIEKNKLIIESLVYKASKNFIRNKIVKMIAQPQYVESITNPHYFNFVEGFYAVNSAKNPLPPKTFMQEVIIDTIRINHYWSGTLNWFYQQKMPRRKNWGQHISTDFIEYLFKALNHEKDESILKFMPKLKEKLI